MNSFQGDPAIFIDENGADMKFTGGQPVTDRGFENAVQISLFTKKGWWGNVLTNEESKKIGSDVEVKSKDTITLSTLNELKEEIDRSLKWMQDKNIAETESVVLNPSGIRRDAIIRVNPPGRDVLEIILSSNGENWRAQAHDPAHEMRF
jgi:phage gp46-like protein